ncbi:Fic family protein [Streptomyces sp. NPDC049040]|uniref:Fic family protein n=1 Tax=Streptomyces sp. NPDC049040 TaxID=3365593 RepID=UPI00370F86CB
MQRWQRTVLGALTHLPGDAYAKGGRERYALKSETPANFDRRLAQSVEVAVPLSERAARTYLSVAFFHPFVGGNGRAALPVLTFVLARAAVTLDEVSPLHFPRYADALPGGFDACHGHGGASCSGQGVVDVLDDFYG